MHWLLLRIVSPKYNSNFQLEQRGKIYLYDPYLTSNKATSTEKDDVISVLSLMFPVKHKASTTPVREQFEFVDAGLPQISLQTDASSCGIHVLTIMEFLVNNIEITMESFPTTNALQSEDKRIKIAISIIEKKLLYI
jgi:hypothetical protein